MKRNLLEVVGVLPVPPVGGPARGLYIRHTPRLRAEHPKRRGGVHRPGPDLDVVGLLHHASLLHPETLEPEVDLLKIQLNLSFKQTASSDAAPKRTAQFVALVGGLLIGGWQAPDAVPVACVDTRRRCRVVDASRICTLLQAIQRL